MTASRLCLGVDLVAALFWIFAAARLARMKREIDRLGAAADSGEDRGPWPKISVLVPARDEAAGIETALRSLLAQDYPALEVVAIDDRSTDVTGRIMDRMAAADPRLTVVHVREL